MCDTDTYIEFRFGYQSFWYYQLSFFFVLFRYGSIGFIFFLDFFSPSEVVLVVRWLRRWRQREKGRRWDKVIFYSFILLLL